MAAKKVDYSKMKLGKHPARHDPRTLLLHNYLDVNKLPKAPVKLKWGKRIADNDWHLMRNHKLEDCTIAAAGHLIMEWTVDNGKIIIPNDKQIVSAYSAVSGYNPKTGNPNDGANCLDVLKHWRKKGIAGYKIMAYTKLDHKNHSHIKHAAYMFGGCYAGFLLPATASKQRVWRLTSVGLKGRGAPGSWGGHAVAIIGYDEDGLTAITWGETKKLTWAFWDAYCEESYIVISHEFAKKKGSPSGFNLEALQKDLEAVVKRKK